MRELKSIEERILDSTLYMIGSYGSLNVPVRAIVKHANVNISAINYYFGSKENMMRLTKEFFIENIKAIYSILDNEAVDEKERLVMFANEIMEHTMRYSGLTAIFKDAHQRKDEDEVSRAIVEETKILQDKMENHLNKIAKKDGKTANNNVIMFMSAIICPAERGESLYSGTDILHNKESRIEYINYMISRLLE